MLNTATPTIGLSYSDIGTGVDTSTLVINANGAVLNVGCTFGAASASCTPTTPLAGGATTLSATIKDFAGNISHKATVSFTIGINQPPVAVDDTATTTAGTPVNVSVLTNDSDPDGDALTVTSFTQGANGTVTFVANVATYTPAAGLTGNDSFTYTISDGHGGSATATVNVSVSPTGPTITSFNPTNGTVGATVAIQGTAFDPAPGKTIVKFNGVGAVVTSLSQTSIQTAVPLGATTGRITVEPPNGTATSTDDFVVQLQQDFALAVSPTAGAVLQGASTSYTVDLTSTGLEPFTGLATLTLAIGRHRDAQPVYIDRRPAGHAYGHG